MLEQLIIPSRDLDFLLRVAMEAMRARTMFPGNKHMLTAFAEEAGEVAKAFIDHERDEESAEGVVDECVQAAAMAMRCATEGDATFNFVPEQAYGDDGKIELIDEAAKLVQGQLFRDIELFHKKFELSPIDDPGHKLPDDLTEFRLKFMLEELLEYADAVDFKLCFTREGTFEFRRNYGDRGINPEKTFDGLIDLVYVALGTAYLHGFPFNEGWDRVQAANMAKERAKGANDERSVRKHSADIVKPAGWKAPVLSDLLRKQDKDGKAD